MKRALCMTVTALVLVSCQDDSQRGPTDIGGPLFSHVLAITDNQDTYLNQVAKNANFGDSLVLSLRESAKNRVLVAFGTEALRPRTIPFAARHTIFTPPPRSIS